MAAAAHALLTVCCRRYDSGQMQHGDVVTVTRATDTTVAVQVANAAKCVAGPCEGPESIAWTQSWDAPPPERP